MQASTSSKPAMATRASARSAKTRLSVVLCDIHMPGKSGLELLEELKASGANVRVPIVMLTSEGDPVLVQRAKLAGAKGWVVKPFKAGLLVSAIQKWTA